MTTKSSLTATEQLQRACLKDAYYGISNKVLSLHDLRTELTTPAARAELGKILADFNDVQRALESWACRHLPKWD